MYGEIPGKSLPAGRQVAAYLIRATFSQKRMDYSPEQATVVYRSKDGKEKKTYDALEWLAAMACHVPERRKQTIRYWVPQDPEDSFS